MSTNSTTTTTTNAAVITYPPEVIIVAYFSIVFLIIGIIFNSITFIVFCRRKFRDTKARPILHYMRVIAIFDILMLFGWNLDHFFYPLYGFYLQKLTLGSCKFLTYFNYFTLQASAWLRVFICHWVAFIEHSLVIPSMFWWSLQAWGCFSPCSIFHLSSLAILTPLDSLTRKLSCLLSIQYGYS